MSIPVKTLNFRKKGMQNEVSPIAFDLAILKNEKDAISGKSFEMDSFTDSGCQIFMFFMFFGKLPRQIYTVWGIDHSGIQNFREIMSFTPNCVNGQFLVMGLVGYTRWIT